MKKHGTYYEEDYNKYLDINKGIFIDIFILDNSSSNSGILLHLRKNLHDKLSSILRMKILVKTYPKKTTRQKTGLVLSVLFNKKLLQKGIQRLMINNNSESNYFSNIASHYGIIRHTIPKEMYFPVSKLEFEGKKYNVPYDYDYVLKSIFGDYNKLPPEEMRVPSHNT